jgi:branched-chain amino acid transport system ATP-binding protein
VNSHQEIDNMSATETPLLEPEKFGSKNFFSTKKEIYVLLVVHIIVMGFMWITSPGLALLGISFSVIYGILALALNYQAAVTGVINFGVVGFFAIGAYTTGIMTLLGWAWPISLFIGMIFTAIFTYLISLPTLKLKEDYFAIFTITFGEIIRIFLLSEYWLVYPSSDSVYFGGSKGLLIDNEIAKSFGAVFGPIFQTIFDLINVTLVTIGFPKTIVLNGKLYHIADSFILSNADSKNIPFVIIGVLFLFLVYKFFEKLYNSPLGRLNKSMREDELSCETLGYNVPKEKLKVMYMGNLLVGLSGGLYAYFLGQVSPFPFIPLITFFVWSIMVLGGSANNRGILIGSLVFSVSQPLFIYYKDEVKSIFVFFMDPLFPNILDQIIAIFYSPIRNLKLSYFSLTFIFVIIVLIGLYYIQKEKNKRNILKWLIVLNVIPLLFQNLALLPSLTFDNNKRVTDITFIPLSEFFIQLDPILGRNIALGLTLILFILFKPEGIIKERQIKTVDSIEEYEKFYQKKVNSTSEDNINIPRALDNGEIDSENLLEAKNVNKTFGGVIALEKATVTVKKGNLLGIIGPNGSGKSTFFNVLTGVLKQDKNKEGKINFLNTDITSKSISDISLAGLGRTFQQSRLFKNLTVLENLLVSAKKQKGVKIMNVLKQNWIEEEKELHQSAFGILDFLNILHIWNNKASDISGGQQKLVSLGRSLMMQSNLILLDEPVAGVNPTLAKKVFMKIEQLQMKEGHNFVIIEHNMDVQLNFCDYLFVFDKGQVVAEGTPNEIRNNQDVLDAYLGN